MHSFPSVNIYRDTFHIADRGAATAANSIPKRKPDAVVEEKTQQSQAALYRYVFLPYFSSPHSNGSNRLSGDRNPLHVSTIACFRYVAKDYTCLRYCPSSQLLEDSTGQFFTVFKGPYILLDHLIYLQACASLALPESTCCRRLDHTKRLRRGTRVTVCGD